MRLFAAILLFSATLLARAEEPQWYQVEIIIFENKDPAAWGSEFWPENPGVPNTTGAMTLMTTRPTAAAPGPSGGPVVTLPLQAYSALAPEQFQLAEAYGKLATSGRYQPLLHIAWLQPGTGNDTGRAVHVISKGTTKESSVDGAITVSRGRVLQVDADLLYHHSAATPQDTTNADKVPQAARLVGSRRVRMQELTYFDHPLMGLLVYVAPYGVK